MTYSLPPLPTATLQLGGYGVIPYGRHKYGARDGWDFQATPEALGPRFNKSKPLDGAQHVPAAQWITFELYSFSNTVNYDDPSGDGTYPVEVSEDGGVTWEYADTAPYSCLIRPLDGQVTWIKILKSSDWTDDEEVVIRTTVMDEFGNSATDQFPVKWAGSTQTQPLTPALFPPSIVRPLGLRF